MRLPQNVGTLDRAIRIIVGLALGAGVVAGAVAGPLAYVIGAVAAIMLVTGAVGFCPLYALVRFSTRPAPGRVVR
jgi:hypothetical protein